jgi:hypothetical protein
MCFADTCCPTHSPRVAFLGPWTPPLLAGSFGPRDDHPTMYVRLTSVVYALLMPVAQPTAHVRRPLAL